MIALVPTAIRPVLVMPPEKVPAQLQMWMPLAPPVIVPLLVMPPVNDDTAWMLMPTPVGLIEIRPALVMPPSKLPWSTIEIPEADAIVPVLVMPPENVTVWNGKPDARTTMPAKLARIVPAFVIPPVNRSAVAGPMPRPPPACP